MFQLQSEISKHWFDIDLEWFDGNFITREPGFYKGLFQKNIEDQDVIKLPTFPVPTVKEKETGEIEFHPLTPTLEYHQKSYIFFNNLASAFTVSVEHAAARAIKLIIKEYFLSV